MPNINIDQKTFDFLMNIKDQLETQDNRCTADPIFEVRTKTRDYGIDSDYSDEYEWTDDDGTEVGFDHDDMEGMKEYLTDIGEWGDGLNDYELEEKMEKAGFRKCYFRMKTNTVQSFFTEAAAKEYIRINGHNLPQERFIYANGTFRNAEMKGIKNFILNIN